LEEGGVGGYAEATTDGFCDCFFGFFVDTFTADGEVVVFLEAIEVDGEGEVFGGLVLVEVFFEEECVGAEVDIFFLFDEFFYDEVHFGMEHGFAAEYGDDWCATFFDCFHALVEGEFLFEYVCGVLDFAASGAGEIAAEDGFEHEDEWVVFSSFESLFYDIGCDGVHLADWYTHW